MFFDPLYWLLIGAGMALSLWAQFRVKSTFGRYSRVGTSSGMTGAQIAQRILADHRISDVRIEPIAGELTDHYDPSKRKLGLSRGVAQSASVASLGIVAHEVGHAVQHSEGYGPLKLRSAIVPAVQIGTWLGPILFIVGFLLQAYNLAIIGVIVFAAGAVFSLVTLPVEFNASSRAMAMLTNTGLVTQQEYKGAKSVLSAAALTYVAAAAQSISTLLYYVFMLGGLRRND